MTTLVLHNVNKAVFEAFVAAAPTLMQLASLSLDLTSGSWDHGEGSALTGPSTYYEFKPLPLPHLTKFTLTATKVSLSSKRSGPFELVRSSPLTELHLIVHDAYVHP